MFFTKPMKVAHCLPDHHWIEEMRGDNPKDAAHIQQKYISDGLQKRGHTVTRIAPQGLQHVCMSDSNEIKLAPRTWTTGRWFDLLAGGFWKVQKLLHIPYLNYFSNLRRYDACMQILRGYDVVFERNSLYNSGVAMACRKLHRPYVIFFDADQIAELDYMGRPLRGLLRWRARNLLSYNLSTARRVICVTETTKNHLQKYWSVPPDKLVVLPNAVDVDRFKPEPRLGSQIRTALNLQENPLVIFVGSFYQWHDVETLLKAFVVVLKSHADARLVLVGDGTEREAMMRLSENLGLDGVAQFTGFVKHSDVARYMNAADIAVVPVPAMKQELWLSPMKLFEYMASGKAVIASAVGQIGDVIKDNQNGVLVPAGDETALAKAINRLLDDESLRSRLGDQARESVVQNHSWEQYLSRLEKVFMDVV